MSKRHVLFISHDAGRTGAPFVFLHFLRWLRKNTDIPFIILLKRGGDLEGEFRELGPVHVLAPPRDPNPTLVSRIHRRIVPIERAQHRRMNEWLRQYHVGLVYSNTTENGQLLETLSRLGCPVISHLHELEHWIRIHTGPVGTKQLMAYTTHFVVGSEAVRENLTRNHGVPNRKIDLVRDCVPVTNWEHQFSDFVAGSEADPDGLLVGGAGTIDWRKGPDLFIQLALAIRRKRPDFRVRFVWVGGDLSGETFAKLLHDVELAGLRDRVEFLGARSDYLRVLSGFDVFCLTSREDACPLVMLESALLRKPIVCFDGSGGGPEFVRGDAGRTASYLDVEEMADQVLGLLDDPALRARLGECGRARVRELHDVAVSGPQMAHVIGRFLA